MRYPHQQEVLVNENMIIDQIRQNFGTIIVQFDRNRDGHISQDELIRFLKKQGLPHFGARGLATAIFSSLDRNQDELLSLGEVQGALHTMPAQGGWQDNSSEAMRLFGQLQPARQALVLSLIRELS